MTNQDFEEFFNANKRRIHFQIYRLGISDRYDEFYTEGIVALWKAYQDFDAIKGNVGTFLNFRIRYSLINLLRTTKRKERLEEDVLQHGITEMTSGTRIRHSDTPLVDIPSLPITDNAFWESIRNQLTDNQWKWVAYYIIADMSVREIMEIENVSADAVKGWGRATRKKLRTDTLKRTLKEAIQS